MLKYKLIIWDIDGTLLDTHEGVSSALSFTLEQYGISKSKAEILEMVHTPKIKDAFVRIADLDEEKAKEATDTFRKQYVEQDLFKATPYKGIMEVLSYCAENGIKQAIATNKRQDCANNICSHFKIDNYCSPICGGDRYNSLSKADLIKQCLQAHNIDNYKNVVMVGDTTSDKTAAAQAGIDFIGVNYGFGFKNVEGYANSPNEILDSLGIKI